MKSKSHDQLKTGLLIVVAAFILMAALKPKGTNSEFDRGFDAASLYMFNSKENMARMATSSYDTIIVKLPCLQYRNLVEKSGIWITRERLDSLKKEISLCQ